MLHELSVIPLGRGRSVSGDIAELVKIIPASGRDSDGCGNDPRGKLGAGNGRSPEVPQ